MSEPQFTLKFSPRFAAQRKAFLAQSRVSNQVFVEPLESALEAITDGSTFKGTTSNQLWMHCVRVNRPLLIKAFWIAVLASSFATASTLIATQILKNQSNLAVLLLCSLAYFITNSVALFGSYSNNRLRSWIGLTSETFLTAAISKKLLKLNAMSVARQSSGNLKVLITSDVATVGEFLNNFVRNFIPSVIAILIMTPVLIHYAGKAGIFGMSALLMIIPITTVINTYNTRLADASQSRMDELTSLIGEWIKNIRLVRFLSWENALQTHITRQLRKFMKVAVLQHLMMCLLFGLSTTWWMVTAASILLYSHYSGQTLDLTGFFGSIWLLSFIAGYLTHIPNTIRLFAMASPSMKRIAKLLSEPEQADSFKSEINTLVRVKTDPARVIFQKVSFEVTPGQPILKNLSIEIELNVQLAILGEVGSGKTTFLKLLCGEVPPTSGTILIEFADGTRSDLWIESTYHRFREFLAYVPQQPYVSSDLLSTNVSLAEHHDEGSVMLAAQMAELLSDLEQLPLGIQQPIGESGVNLSGGQKQRLNLARAFHSQRGYLVLDDTLSAVDAKTEAMLMKTLGTKTGFVLVTHRLNEIMSVGHVVVIKAGEIVEDGSPEQLARDPNSAFTRALQAYDSLENGGQHV